MLVRSETLHKLNRNFSMHLCSENKHHAKSARKRKTLTKKTVYLVHQTSRWSVSTFIRKDG